MSIRQFFKPTNVDNSPSKSDNHCQEGQQQITKKLQKTLECGSNEKAQAVEASTSTPCTEKGSRTCLPGKGNSKGRVIVKKCQANWTREFEWLRYEVDNEQNKMYCLICEKGSSVRKSLMKNVFVKGCTNFQHSSLTRHQASADHLLAKSVSQQKRYMAAAQTCVKKQYMPILEAQIKTAIFLAQENLPNRKQMKLINLQIQNGCDVFKNSKGILTNHQAASKFQKYAANVLRDAAITRIKNSPFIGLMLDESLDIAVNKKLILFCKILYKDEVRIEFAANISIADGKADTLYNCIMNFLTENGIDILRVSGLGSDGASVMLGRVNGVGVRLKTMNSKIVHMWCAAHRVALVSFWAAKSIPYLQKVNDVLVQVFNFYQYSAPRYHKLRELQQILGKKVKRFKKPTNVRWLSLSEAVAAFHTAYSALILSLDHEQASNPRSEGAAVAKGILKRIKNFKFLVTLSFLKDILAILDRVSKLFQSDRLNVQTLNNTISSTKQLLLSFNDNDPETVEDVIDIVEESEQYHGVHLTVNLVDRRNFIHFKKKFIRNLIEQFNNRFPNDDLCILKHLNIILNPTLLSTSNLNEYGLDSLERCITHFTADPPLIEARRLRNAFLQFKYLMNTNREMHVEDFCLMLIMNYKEAFPDFCILAKFFCTCPLTSVPCERGFSLQNRHHNASSSRRNVENVQHRMFIEYNSKNKEFSLQDVAYQAAQNYSDNN